MEAVKANTVKVTGVLERADFQPKEDDPFAHSYYGPPTENYQAVLDCALRPDDGGPVCYFKVRNKWHVTSGGPFAIVGYDGERVQDGKVEWPANHPWFDLTGEQAVASPCVPADKHLEPKVKVGDRVTVTGRVKTERVSQKGNTYRVLNYVKRLAD
jgi:hypothetical protein